MKMRMMMTNMEKFEEDIEMVGREGVESCPPGR
jgi:hypothetical protein